MSDGIRVNGNQHSWGSIVLKLDGDKFHGFKSISYGDKRERVKGYGMGKHHAPRSRTRGKYTVEPVKVTGPTASCQNFRAALAAKSKGGKSYGDVEFETVVQFIDTGDADITVEIERCVITSGTFSGEENPDPEMDEMEFDAMLIRRNGLVLFDASEGSP